MDPTTTTTAANAKKAATQWNPQDDLGSPKPPKELYICCHVRRVELGIEDNDDSGGGKAASEAVAQQNLQMQMMKSDSVGPTLKGMKRDISKQVVSQ